MEIYISQQRSAIHLFIRTPAFLYVFLCCGLCYCSLLKYQKYSARVVLSIKSLVSYSANYQTIDMYPLWLLLAVDRIINY